MKTITETQALQKLTTLCSRAEHCSYEVQEKLCRWAVPEDAQARIMTYLIDHQYIDDNRYCQAFIEDKLNYNHWGRRKIEQALWLKRIDKGISAPLLDEITKEEWLEHLRPQIKRLLCTTKADNNYKLRQKVIRTVLGRGFDLDLILQCIDDMPNEDD